MRKLIDQCGGMVAGRSRQSYRHTPSSFPEHDEPRSSTREVRGVDGIYGPVVVMPASASSLLGGELMESVK